MRSGSPTHGRARHRHAPAPGGVRPALRIGSKVLAGLVSFTALLGTGWGWYNITDLNRNAHVLHISGLATPPSLPDVASDAPRVHGSAENILIVGIDSRAGLTAAQRHALGVGNDTSTSTDTIMLVHIPADGSKATLISIPRDSWVHIPGYADAKINAAYADGYYLSGAQGAQAQQEAAVSTLVATVKQLTGVAIDHYVQVGFSGFVEIVRAIGKIPIDLCRSVNDTVTYNRTHGQTGGSGFRMSAGPHELTAKQALQFVRQRHNIPGPVPDDLGRELRQRYFLSAAFKKVLSSGTLLDPFKLRRLIKAVDDAFTFDDRNFNITEFAGQMVNLSAGNITGRSIPTQGAITIDHQDALKVDPAQVRAVVHRAFHPRTRTTHPSPAPTRHTTGHHRTSGAPTGMTRPADQGCVY